MYVYFFKKWDFSSQTTYREEKQPFAWTKKNNCSLSSFFDKEPTPIQVFSLLMVTKHLLNYNQTLKGQNETLETLGPKMKTTLEIRSQKWTLVKYNICINIIRFKIQFEENSHIWEYVGLLIIYNQPLF